jgi:hypothetical protein
VQAQDMSKYEHLRDFDSLSELTKPYYTPDQFLACNKADLQMQDISSKNTLFHELCMRADQHDKITFFEKLSALYKADAMGLTIYNAEGKTAVDILKTRNQFHQTVILAMRVLRQFKKDQERKEGLHNIVSPALQLLGNPKEFFSDPSHEYSLLHLN